MKKLLLAALLGSTTLGMAQQKGMVHLEAEYSKKDIDEISIINLENNNVIQTIKADANGLFKADIKLPKAGEYKISAKTNALSSIYLKNNESLSLKTYYNNDKEIESYSGSLSPENNYLYGLYRQENDYLWDLPEEEFKKTIHDLEKNKNNELMAFKNFDSETKTKELGKIKHYYGQLDNLFQIFKLEGTYLPSFKLENMNDNQLFDANQLKGKYTFIDVWATYCSPCIYEMPKLKALEEKFRGKNIQFISIAADLPTNKALCKKLIDKNELSNPQYILHPSESLPFVKGLKITTLPRFILVDPDGKVIQPQAKRPSDPKLAEELDKLLN